MSAIELIVLNRFPTVANRLRHQVRFLVPSRRITGETAHHLLAPAFSTGEIRMADWRCRRFPAFAFHLQPTPLLPPRLSGAPVRLAYRSARPRRIVSLARQ